MDDETIYRTYQLILRDIDEDTETSESILVDAAYGEELDIVLLGHLRESLEKQYSKHKRGQAEWSGKFRL